MGYAQYANLCGIVFLYIDDDNSGDYWDDDYEEGMNEKRWLASKYTGPYCYDGNMELLLSNRKRP